MPTRPIAPSVNVTAESAATVANPLTGWLTTVEQTQTEHLAGTTRSAELIHFYWERIGDIKGPPQRDPASPRGARRRRDSGMDG